MWDTVLVRVSISCFNFIIDHHHKNEDDDFKSNSCRLVWQSESFMCRSFVWLTAPLTPLLSCSGLTGSSRGGRWQCQSRRHCSCLHSLSLVWRVSNGSFTYCWEMCPFTVPLSHSHPLSFVLYFLVLFSPRAHQRFETAYAHMRTGDYLFTLVFNVFFLYSKSLFPSCPPSHSAKSFHFLLYFTQILMPHSLIFWPLGGSRTRWKHNI